MRTAERAYLSVNLNAIIVDLRFLGLFSKRNLEMEITNEYRVMKCLESSMTKFRCRTAEGISKELQIPEDEVKFYLENNLFSVRTGHHPGKDTFAFRCSQCQHRW